MCPVSGTGAHNPQDRPRQLLAAVRHHKHISYDDQSGCGMQAFKEKYGDTVDPWLSDRLYKLKPLLYTQASSSFKHLDTNMPHPPL